MSPRDETARKLAYIERELGRKDREEATDHLIAVRADLLRRAGQA